MRRVEDYGGRWERNLLGTGQAGYLTEARVILPGMQAMLGFDVIRRKNRKEAVGYALS